ncbi:hypothetical protein QE152_g4628 [Popillia japonica]|uniref:Uncharacterized protein n=1 Tax=Popillia japonica TaxID=7064 RepID=A0AAW1MUH4_POPJA
MVTALRCLGILCAAYKDCEKMSDNPGPSKRVRYDDPDFERTFLKWSEECGDEYSDEEEVDESYWKMSEHDSNSDDETNEVELDEIIQDEDPEESQMQKEGVSENISSVTKSYYLNLPLN